MDILTIRYLGPTNFRGARWVAKMGEIRKVFSYGVGREEWGKIIKEVFWEWVGEVSGKELWKGVFIYSGEIVNGHIFTYIPQYCGIEGIRKNYSMVFEVE